MLALNRKTEYGLIALTYLADYKKNTASAKLIATTYGMSSPLLMNVLKTLTKAGLVNSTRGPSGGYSLAKNAETITLADIISALQGSLKLVACINKHDDDDTNSIQECKLAQLCPVQSPVRKIHIKLRDFLESITLSDLLTSSPSGLDLGIDISAVSGGKQ